MWNRNRRRGAPDITLRAVLPIALALGVDGSSHAGEGEWTVQLEPMYVQAYGHDPHVLTVHETDFDSTPALDNKTAVNLETDGGIAYRGGLRYTGRQWGWGVDFFWFVTSQNASNRTAAAEGPSGTIDEVAFEVADQTFTSSDPSEVLFYSVLEDTDLEVWTLDVYARRTLAEKPESSLHLLFGLRNGDFDNDYRAVVGVQDVAGSRLDSSSNYDRMMGPLIALAGDVHIGKSDIEGYIGQSVVFGGAELSSMSREFTGPFSSTPAFFDQEVFRKQQDVAIPITEFRLKWTYTVRKNVSLGVGANASAWWDVPVPPGVIPIEGGDEALHENTIVFFGVLGALVWTF